MPAQLESRARSRRGLSLVDLRSLLAPAARTLAAVEGVLAAAHDAAGGALLNAVAAAGARAGECDGVVAFLLGRAAAPCVRAMRSRGGPHSAYA